MTRPLTITEGGKIVCEICGKSFDRVCAHARQKHNISAREYKRMFGLDAIKGICSERSSRLSRVRVYENYECIAINLIESGKKTRFKKGSEGRTRDKCSKETLDRLTKQIVRKRGTNDN